jgi:hypothetical protein
LADDGWRTVLRKRAALLSNDDDRSLNTPKAAQVREFFRRNVGIQDITSSWRWHKNPPDRTTMLLDGLVNLRGSIAPSRLATWGVLKKHATSGLDPVQRLAATSAHAVSIFLLDHTKAELPELGSA